jgi:flavin-dependent dehydrogenase
VLSERADIFDVVIVGGGPAGASAGIHLARAGARVLIVEQGRFPRAKLCGEFISPECLPHFARLGVLGGMLAAGGREVRETVFYTRGGRSVAVPSEWFGGVGAGCELAGLDGAALGLSRAEMDEQLLERARAVGVEVLEETQAVGLLCEAGEVRGVRVRGRAGAVQERRALLTFDATGRARSLARFLEHAERRSVAVSRRINAETSGRRAPFVAFKAHLEGARGAAGSCEIYFYSGGYGGLSPVEGGRSNLCFIASARDVRESWGDAARVLREVVQTNARAEFALAEARACTPWLAVALESFGRRELCPASGLLTLGDAASFIDPFTGSGMLMALESGELAASVAARWLPQMRRDAHETQEAHNADDPTATRSLAGGSFRALAAEYGASYGARFGGRLRVCSWLRRAAFAPPALAEACVVALGASARVRRALARATRGSAGESLRAGARR